MRIVYLFMTYPMAAQPFAISDVRALEAKGHEVDVYALRFPGRDHAETVRRYGLELPAAAHPGAATWRAVASPHGLVVAAFLVRLLSTRLVGRPVEFVKTLALLPRLVEIVERLRRDPPDVVHAFWGHYPSLVLLLAERFVPSVHRSIFLGAYDLTTHLFSLAPAIARRADSVWTHADANLAILDRVGVPRRRVAVVPRGIPLDLADGPRPATIPDRVCTAANFQREKNLDLVVESFVRFARARPGATLVLAGDGAEREALETQVAACGLADRVTFTGFLSREALFAEMQRAELFVFLSTKPSERLSNVVKEAMLAETLCLVSRTPDIERLVTPGVTGDIVDELDADTVAARMLALTRAPDRGEMTRRAAEEVRAMFSAEAAMERYLAGWRGARDDTSGVGG
jgi:glycosyltransferase involved in cell wall biosynthesis